MLPDAASPPIHSFSLHSPVAGVCRSGSANSGTPSALSSTSPRQNTCCRWSTSKCLQRLPSDPLSWRNTPPKQSPAHASPGRGKTPLRPETRVSVVSSETHSRPGPGRTLLKRTPRQAQSLQGCGLLSQQPLCWSRSLGGCAWGTPQPVHPRDRSRGRRSCITMVASNVGIALVLTCVGSFSTALGGLMVVLQKVPDIKRLGLLQGFAAGLMLSLSFFDLVPNAIQAIGFAAANIWFFSGCLLFAGVVAFIPEPSLLPDSTSETNVASQGNSKLLSSASDKDKGKEGTANGKPASMGDKEGDSDKDPKDSNWRRRKTVLYSGIITAIGISMHNFPEGIAVFLGSMKGLSVGISLAIAIALHNIPEGLAVALPIYYATRNRWTAFKAAALSGLAEPLAVIIVGLFFPGNLAPELIEGMLAGVGGIMAFLTLHEMLPLAFEYAGHRVAVTSAFVGMAVMSANLQLLAWAVPEDVAL